MGQLGLEFVKNGLSEACWNIANDTYNGASYRIFRVFSTDDTLYASMVRASECEKNEKLNNTDRSHPCGDFLMRAPREVSVYFLSSNSRKQFFEFWGDDVICFVVVALFSAVRRR
jgi:hypothetical protein